MSGRVTSGRGDARGARLFAEMPASAPPPSPLPDPPPPPPRRDTIGCQVPRLQMLHGRRRAVVHRSRPCSPQVLSHGARRGARGRSSPARDGRVSPTPTSAPYPMRVRARPLLRPFSELIRRTRSAPRPPCRGSWSEICSAERERRGAAVAEAFLLELPRHGPPHQRPPGLVPRRLQAAQRSGYDYFDRYKARVNAATAADLQRVARRGCLERVRTVVVQPPP